MPVLLSAVNVAGCIILHLLSKLNAFRSTYHAVIVVDTNHLFNSTMPLLDQVQQKYRFTCQVFGPDSNLGFQVLSRAKRRVR